MKTKTTPTVTSTEVRVIATDEGREFVALTMKNVSPQTAYDSWGWSDKSYGDFVRVEERKVGITKTTVTTADYTEITTAVRRYGWRKVL